jgi:hypothetical protein
MTGMLEKEVEQRMCVADAVALAETNIMKGKGLFKQKELKSLLRAVWATWVRRRGKKTRAKEKKVRGRATMQDKWG